MIRDTQFIGHWLFATGEDASCLTDAKPVKIPHTWNVDDAFEYHVGKGWYRTTLPADTLTAGGRSFLFFHGAYRDTDVYVNGQLAARHEGSGYTPFRVELTPYIQDGADVEITVCVDNSFSKQALPYDRSFDWANDGGLYREVELWQTGSVLIEDAVIDAAPVIPPTDGRVHKGQAFFGFSVHLDGAVDGATVDWALYRGAEASITEPAETPLLYGTLPCSADVCLEPRLLDDIVYWHFDRPELYTLCLCAKDNAGVVSDNCSIDIGFRELKLQGETWRLNGEKVRLPGMEWMPGSNPAIGAAESPRDMVKMLCTLKESNTVLTRFHWQQDDLIFDWCDRHGLLVQEEIPYWGKQPEGDPEELWPVVERQLREMITAHRHHPSIIAWGVGNELSAHTWPMQRYIRRATALAHQLDASRTANYVTNTAWRNMTHDGVGDGDIMMINDYIGTWEQGCEQDPAWRELLDAHPGRAFVPSEFGLCEPAFSGGDAARERIFLEKTNYYRKIPSIVGTIYFCLNDYRTHMGEEGKGRLRQRVHGSANLLGEVKPSFLTVLREYSPLIVEKTPTGLRLTCRNDIPCYAVMGYTLRKGAESVTIPDLQPGESYLYEGPLTEGRIGIFRPNGDVIMYIGR